MSSIDVEKDRLLIKREYPMDDGGKNVFLIDYITGGRERNYKVDKEGILHGSYSLYDEDGLLKYSATYEHGVEDGVRVQCLKNGMFGGKSVWKNTIVNNGVPGVESYSTDPYDFDSRYALTKEEAMALIGEEPISNEVQFDPIAWEKEQLDKALEKCAEGNGLDDYSFTEEVLASISEHTMDGHFSVSGYINDVNTHGCASGVVSELIYYRQTKDFYVRNIDDVENYIEEVENDLGEPLKLDHPRYNSAAWLVYGEVTDRLSFDIEEIFQDQIMDTMGELDLSQVEAINKTTKNDFVKHYSSDLIEDMREELRNQQQNKPKNDLSEGSDRSNKKWQEKQKQQEERKGIMSDFNLTSEEFTKLDNELFNAVRERLFSGAYIPPRNQFEVDQNLLSWLVTDKERAETYFDVDVKADMQNDPDKYESLFKSIEECISLEMPDELLPIIAADDEYYQTLFDSIVSSITMEEYLSWCAPTMVEVCFPPNPYGHGMEITYSSLDTPHFTDVGDEYLNRTLQLLNIDKVRFGEELSNEGVYSRSLLMLQGEKAYTPPSPNEACVDSNVLVKAIAEMANNSCDLPYLKVNAIIYPEMLLHVDIQNEVKILPKDTDLILCDDYYEHKEHIPLIRDMQLNKGEFEVKVLSENELLEVQRNIARVNNVDFVETVAPKKESPRSIQVSEKRKKSGGHKI